MDRSFAKLFINQLGAFLNRFAKQLSAWRVDELGVAQSCRRKSDDRTNFGVWLMGLSVQRFDRTKRMAENQNVGVAFVQQKLSPAFDVEFCVSHILESGSIGTRSSAPGRGVDHVMAARVGDDHADAQLHERVAEMIEQPGRVKIAAQSMKHHRGIH